MNKELLEQYQTFRNTDTVISIIVNTVAGCSKITNRALINKIMDLVIYNLKKGEI